jgi:glycine/D-amino acid oxidase-like deaminating enzyme
MPQRPFGEIPNGDFRPHPVWWDDLPPHEAMPAPLPERCDVAIVGGGFAGLSAALELARNGTRVVVLEADALGYGASARNSGGVSFGLNLAKVARWSRWTGRKGPDMAALARGALASVEHMEAFIERHALECDYRRRGRLSCAPTPAHYDALARRTETLNKLFDANAYMLTRAQQSAEIGSERFHGTMVIERSGQLNPARLLHGLIALCEQAGASLHSRTRVTGIERLPQEFRVMTTRGPLHAAAVAVCANARAAEAPSTSLGTRIVPVASNIIVTEPLEPQLAQALIPRQRTGADNRRLLAYFRRTPDGARFLYGSRATPFETTPQRTAAVLYRRMVESFPQLDGVRLSHAWGCKVAFTLDSLPHMGQMDGLYYVAGCNGNGVAMMNYLGHQLARKMLAGGKADCVFDEAAFPKLPLYDGRPWFLPMVAAVYRTLDAFDDRKARLSRGMGVH